jgi:hypothetical protein
MSEQQPTIAALVIHEVEDYDQFRPHFDAHQATRKEASMVGHHFQRGADNRNMIAAYMPATDETKMRAMLVSDDLRAKMQAAGIKGTPIIKVMKPKSNDAILDKELAGMIVWHEVADYDKWREVYDSLDDKRKEAGIIGHAVEVNADKPNEVVVYHQAESVEALKAFSASSDLKEGMKAAGVTSEPEFSYWISSPAVSY